MTNMRYAPDTTRHHQTCSRHHQTPPDMHQTMSDRLAVVLWWFIELYSWSRFFAPTNGRMNEGVPRVLAYKFILVGYLVFCLVYLMFWEKFPNNPIKKVDGVPNLDKILSQHFSLLYFHFFSWWKNYDNDNDDVEEVEEEEEEDDHHHANWEAIWALPTFLDVIASPSSYPCQWVSGSVSEWLIVSDFGIGSEQYFCL